jgi:hypothetical protein
MSAAKARQARLIARNTASRKTRTYKLGGAKYRIKAGQKASARAKLTTKGRAALKRLRKARTTVTVTVVRQAKRTRKQVVVTLLAPKRGA